MPKKVARVSRGIRNIDISYRPLPKQQEAHGLLAKYRGICGGWGNGKTSWGCAEVFFLLHEFPGTRCIVARKTRPELRATTWDMILNGDPGHPHAWKGIPEETIASINKSDMTITFRNGSMIFGLPLDDPKKIENYNLGLFWIDQAEEIEEDIFLKFHGRLRQKVGPREGLLTWNPDGHNWLWRRFFDPRRTLKWAAQYKAIEATTFDNPTLPEDYLEQFEGLPDSWIQRFVYGSHEVFVGQIFTDYDPEVHVVQPFHIPASWPRWLCIDPGIRHEGALSWVAQDFLGNKYYYRELLRKDQPVSWWAEQLFALERAPDWGGPNERIHRRLIGSEALQRNQTTGKSVIDVYNEYGIYPELADRDPAARISQITSHLRPNAGHVNPWTGDDPAPKLYIFADCDKMLDYLPQYRWRPQRVNYAEEDLPEKARKKDDHNIDNLGHILVAIDGTPLPQNLGPQKGMTADQRLWAETWEAEVEEAEGRKVGGYHTTAGRL